MYPLSVSDIVLNAQQCPVINQKIKMIVILLFSLVIALVAVLVVSDESSVVISANKVADFLAEVPCRSSASEDSTGYSPGCISSTCLRRIVDGIFTDDDIANLHAIARKGMSQRPVVGGPTILDINTGYIRDSDGLDNLFTKSNDIYTSEDFAHYGQIIQKLKETVMQTFQLPTLHFTAPTFITRIDADTPWQPQAIHDEYWHPHADHNNTEHYHYSGLLYMSTYGEDFTGGRFKFVNADSHDSFEQGGQGDPVQTEVTMEPRRGRVVIFSSGHENTHHFERVLSGQRYVLSFWFTCKPSKEFQIFLDGQAHVAFSHKFRAAAKQRQAQQIKKSQKGSDL